MTVQTAAGAALEISAGQPATYDSTGFAALTFTNVGEVVSIGEHGGTTALVTHTPLNQRTTKKFKGSINNGSMAVSLGMDLSDAGQQILIDGALGANIDVDHAVKLIYQDGSIEYFQAKIMGYSRNPGSADQIVGASATFELVGAIVDA